MKRRHAHEKEQEQLIGEKPCGKSKKRQKTREKEEPAKEVPENGQEQLGAKA